MTNKSAATKPAVEMTKLRAEQSRTYAFPGGHTVKLEKVTHFAAPGSTHRLKTADGKLHIVNAGWLHIAIEADDWTL
jgi:hypothetical protein